MMPLSDIENDFMELGLKIFKSLGMDTLMSKLFTLIYITPKEISAEELADKTGYSHSSVSMKMKIFEATGQVQRLKKPGSKKVYYQMDKDLNKVVKAKMDIMHQKYMDPVIQNLPGIIEKYKNKNLNKEDREKLQVLKDYYEQIIEMKKRWNKMMEFLIK
ncbi:hypothetical protein JW868_02670 [Candidatus Woesearchaeota archaeon]|nr:hypothetical protein [Candidatus Woesearchaeota archaeon]